MTCQLNIKITSIFNTKINYPFKIWIDSLWFFLVDFIHLSHELTNNADRVCNIWPGCSEIVQTSPNWQYKVPSISFVPSSLYVLVFYSNGVDTTLHSIIWNLLNRSLVYLLFVIIVLTSSWRLQGLNNNSTF